LILWKEKRIISQKMVSVRSKRYQVQGKFWRTDEILSSIGLQKKEAGPELRRGSLWGCQTRTNMERVKKHRGKTATDGKKERTGKKGGAPCTETRLGAMKNPSGVDKLPRAGKWGNKFEFPRSKTKKNEKTGAVT